jgi:hypothetical protein
LKQKQIINSFLDLCELEAMNADSILMTHDMRGVTKKKELSFGSSVESPSSEKKALERKSRSYVKRNYLHYTNYKMIMSVCRYPEQLSKNDLCRIINLTALPITFKKIVKQKCNLNTSI